ncbi:MAG: MFS transporter, partial [Acidimicrobiales bacterium]
MTAPELDDLRRPRTDLVIERTLGPDRWDAARGPFRSYQRRLDVATGPDGRFAVTETTDFSLAVPVWRPLITPLMRRALGSTARTPRRRWWWPRTVVSRRTSELVAVLVTISVMTGYLGALVGQSITFAARQFGSTDQYQATTLAAIRVGVFLSVVLLRQADRVGRRPVIIGFTTAAIVFTAVGAGAPNLWALGLSQAIARGLTTGLITLLLLAVTEEAPAEARAFTISLLTITAALGAGMVVWVLPVADLGGVVGEIGGWRFLYLVPLLFLPVLARLAPFLAETQRFVAADEVDAPAPVSRRWFALLAVAAFASAVFASPASQLRNEFLS